jgi:phospholipid-binding lipoprotein MlaA
MRRCFALGGRRAAAAALLLSLLGGCATHQNPDPFEPVNRKLFAFNETVDEYVLAPVARGYRDVVPEMARTGVTNFFNNLRDLWSSVNALLQGDLEKSGQDWMRFSVNTVLGFGGVVDWASPMGLDPHYEDLGQTFGVWGMEPGAYLVLPFLGSSTARDTLALPADFYAYPDQWVSPDEAAYGLLAWRVVNTRANLLDAGQLLSDISLDKYTFVRDGYLQRRRSQVYNGSPPSEDSERYDLPESSAPGAGTPSPGAVVPPAGASAPRPAASAPAPGL